MKSKLTWLGGIFLLLLSLLPVIFNIHTKLPIGSTRQRHPAWSCVCVCVCCLVERFNEWVRERNGQEKHGTWLKCETKVQKKKRREYSLCISTRFPPPFGGIFVSLFSFSGMPELITSTGVCVCVWFSKSYFNCLNRVYFLWVYVCVYFDLIEILIY